MITDMADKGECTLAGVTGEVWRNFTRATVSRFATEFAEVDRGKHLVISRSR